MAGRVGIGVWSVEGILTLSIAFFTRSLVMSPFRSILWMRSTFDPPELRQAIDIERTGVLLLKLRKSLVRDSVTIRIRKPRSMSLLSGGVLGRCCLVWTI